MREGGRAGGREGGEGGRECVRVTGGRSDGRTEDGGRGRRRRSGYSTKNKNPTRQCGEKDPKIYGLSWAFHLEHLGPLLGILPQNHKTTKPRNGVAQPLPSPHFVFFICFFDP